MTGKQTKMLSGICIQCFIKAWTILCQGPERLLCYNCPWDLCQWAWRFHLSSSANLNYAVGELVVSSVFGLVLWINLGSMLKVACLQSCPCPCLLGWKLELCCSLISGPISFCYWPDFLYGPGSSLHLLWDCWWELLSLVLAWAVLLAPVLLLLPHHSQPCLANLASCLDPRPALVFADSADGQ